MCLDGETPTMGTTITMGTVTRTERAWAFDVYVIAGPSHCRPEAEKDPKFTRSRTQHHAMLRPLSTLLAALQNIRLRNAWARCILTCGLAMGIVSEGLGQVPRNDMRGPQMNAATWTVQCSGAGPTMLLDTTFVGRVRLRPGGIVWQVTRETLTPIDDGKGDRAELGRRNYATGDCIVVSRPARSDLIPRLNRPGRPTDRGRRPQSDTGATENRPRPADPRETVPEEALPDSLYRRADSTQRERNPEDEPGGSRGESK